MGLESETQLRDLFSRLKPGGRLLGIDLGTKTLGLALSDPALRIASPLTTLGRTKLSKDLQALEKLIESNSVGGIVLGLPINMDGTEGPRAQSTRAFYVQLRKNFPMPVALWDERLSTAAVNRTLLAADISRRRRAQVVDKLAAAYILQGALDRMSRFGDN